jgi:DNA repair protein RecO (recombination protein O)
VRDLRDDAVVLRAYRSGEADRIVVLYTREHGKLRALAKGVRRPSTKIGGSLEPLAEVAIFLARGTGELSYVRQVELRERREIVRGDFDRLTAAMALVEAVDAIPLEGVADGEIFAMLSRALGTLDDPQFAPMLVPAAFFLRLLAHDGSAPVVEECVGCSTRGPLVAFDAGAGGAQCANCRTGRSMSPDALALLQRMLGGELGNVLRESGPRGASEVAALAHDAIESHLGRRLRVARSSPGAPAQ